MPKKENKYSSDCFTKNEKDSLMSDLKHSGYLLPTSDEELEEFEKMYGNTQTMFPEHLKNPDFLHKGKSAKLTSVKPKETINERPKKVTAKKAPVKSFAKNTYFKKLVLAAEIANQLHGEYTFGHVKFVKVLYLCEEVCNIQLNSNYGKYAAGPLDPKSMYSIDGQFKRRKWFNISKSKYGYKYLPEENIEEYKKYYLNYFSNQKDKIDFLINLFRKEKTDFCEIVATLFAVWKENLQTAVLINERNLLEGFFAWSKEKKRFAEKEIIDALNWMNDQNITPVS